MLATIARFLTPAGGNYFQLSARFSSTLLTISSGKYGHEQMEYIKSSLQNKIDDWQAFRKDILHKQGAFNEKNVDGVLFKVMIKNKSFDTAKSFADYVKSSGNELNLGVINGLLNLYYELGKENKLSEEEKQFILNSYENLYKKYEVLDSTTSERLLHALCVIDEWKKAFKVLDDIHMSCNPTHSAYSTLIATLFKLNKKTEALKLIDRSYHNRRPLKHTAYEAWINYVLRKYKDENKTAKYLDEICVNISRKFTVIPEKTAELMKDTFNSLGWHARFTKLRKQNGQCVYCQSTLDCLKLSEKEFQLLQKNIKDKIIVGSDILLKTSPEELKKFLDFVEKTGPYDIVLDALNICYGAGRYKTDKVGPLTFVVEHFRQQNKRILLIGRKHMLKWPNMKYLLSKTCNFFTDNISQDDPYFITAAILSGSHTDFVSRDQLRGHRFQLQDEQLRHLFQRWQWQHQWMVFINRHGSPVMQAPLPVTPCAQKQGSNWHLPFEREEGTPSGLVRDGTPDWTSWLCLQAPSRSPINN